MSEKTSASAEISLGPEWLQKGLAKPVRGPASASLEHNSDDRVNGLRYERATLISLLKTLELPQNRGLFGALLPAGQGFAAIYISSLVADGVLPANHVGDSATPSAARRGAGRGASVVEVGDAGSRRAHGRGRGLSGREEDGDLAAFRMGGESLQATSPQDSPVCKEAPAQPPTRSTARDGRASAGASGRPFSQSPMDSEGKMFGSASMDQDGEDFFFCDDDDEEEEAEPGPSAPGSNHATSFLSRVLKKKLHDGVVPQAEAEDGVKDKADLLPPMPQAPPPQTVAPPRPPVPLERPPPPPSAPPAPPESSIVSAGSRASPTSPKAHLQLEQHLPPSPTPATSSSASPQRDAKASGSPPPRTHPSVALPSTVPPAGASPHQGVGFLPTASALQQRTAALPPRTSLNLASALPASSTASMGTGLQNAYQGYIGGSSLPVDTGLTGAANAAVTQKAQPQSQLNPAAAVFQAPALSTAAAVSTSSQQESQGSLKAKCWWYRDPQGLIQGPFSMLEMRHWNSCGYFAPDLPIRYTENASFYPLRMLYPSPLVPFQSFPALGQPGAAPPPRNPAGAAINESNAAAAVASQAAAGAAASRGLTAGAVSYPAGALGANGLVDASAGYSSTLRNMLGMRPLTGYEEVMAAQGLLGGDPAALGLGLGGDPSAASRMLLQDRWSYGGGDYKAAAVNGYGVPMLPPSGPLSAPPMGYGGAELWGHASAAAAAASLANTSGMMNVGNSADHYRAELHGEGLAPSLAAGLAGGERHNPKARREGRRKQAAVEAPLQNNDIVPGQYAGGWLDPMCDTRPASIDLASSNDFPTLGGTKGSEERVVMADVPAEQSSNGFWERPLRAVKVAAPVGAGGADAAAVGSSPPAPRRTAEAPRRSRGDVEEQLAERRTQLEELLRRHNLHLDEPVLGFLLSLSTAADVLDYLLALHGDSEDVRRFAEAFADQRLGAPRKDDSRGADKEHTKGQKDASDSNTPKANRRRRGKGKEVDPSLLGFTAASSRIMQGSIDHGD